MKTILIIVLLALSSCSFSYNTWRDCDGKKHKAKIQHPRPEVKLGM